MVEYEGMELPDYVVADIIAKKNKYAKQTDDNKNLLKKLKDEGHKCVHIMETFPAKIRWCHQTPCADI